MVKNKRMGIRTYINIDGCGDVVKDFLDEETVVHIFSIDLL